MSLKNLTNEELIHSTKQALKKHGKPKSMCFATFRKLKIEIFGPGRARSINI
jgi:hypothetical protein